jgi:PKD repeat protein
MKRFITILPLLSLIVISCNREPIAEASVDPNPAYVGEYVRFESHSTNTDYVEWDMDDGIMYSTPVVDHYFVDPGFYDVTLRAFGSNGGVSSVVIPEEVIGAELTVVVRLWTDIEMGEAPGYLLPGASVILYTTLQDWDDRTNPVLLPDGSLYELFTNSIGECTFTGLSYKRYYIDVWEANHDNEQLGLEDAVWIETPMLEGVYVWTFEAMVDYYADGKKAAVAGERPPRTLKAAPSGEKRTPGEIVKKVPRERK